MRRLVDSFASVAYYSLTLFVAVGLTVYTLTRDLLTALRNIWSS